MVDVWIMSAVAARRDWLSSVIAGERGLAVIGIAPTFSFLSTLMSETAGDLAVVDLDNDDIPEQIRDWVLSIVDRIPVLCLSPEPHSTILNRMIATGVGGILSSDASSTRVVEAIKAVASGFLLFDGALMRQQPRRDPEDAPAGSLTPREIEVLELLAEGMGNKEIAAQLNISQHTIKFHIRSILSKLGASSRTEAVSRGLRSGLIDL